MLNWCHFPLVVLLLVVQLTAGCSSVKPHAPDSSAVMEKLAPGQVATIVLADGQVHEIRVGKVDSREIRGMTLTDKPELKIFRLADIAEVQFETLDGGKTALAVVGATVGVVVLLPIAALGVGLGIADH